MSILVTGGARSGKSAFAEKLCKILAPEAIYIATAQAYDNEMRERIALHTMERSQADYAWTTVEEPINLAELLQEWGQTDHTNGAKAPTIMVDCLTLWLSNVLLSVEEQHEVTWKVKVEIQRLVELVASYPGNLILVTNEVGDGIVPEYPLGRLYRDFAGLMNQAVARVCSQVFLVTAGIPIELKRLEYKL
ncbi:adenosylcobinamide kinase/adenosylcobinamide-phosphate guanylyltransferase [Paenibacillus sp. DS2015]|uniref:bifunctional adenosylcobinamide kinase/adenosylcobinamide-phosphate guanylyltransferase n=1 Tax=Paenibacillus sp. DS2015 TaxID=3373917 RepID=UPI003D1FFF68